MKRSALSLVILLSVFFQFVFISAGYVNIWGCNGDSPCITVTSVSSCYCDSVSGTVSCSLTGFIPSSYCSLEGNYYVMASSDCISSIPSTPSSVFAFNINWDANADDCACKVGTGKWLLPGIRTGSCCSDDATEHYFSASSPQNKNATYDFCCDDSTDYVVGSTCCNSANYAGSETEKSCDGTFACCGSVTDSSKRGICVSTCAELLEVSWKDNTPEAIVEAGVNATVNLFVQTEYFEEKTIDFKIYNQDDELVDSILNVVPTSDTTSVSWKVPNLGEYYFNVGASDGSTNTLTSDFLSVNDAAYNLPPIAKIYSPTHGDSFLINEQILFSAVGSYDKDDSITKTLWSIGDGKTSDQFIFQESYSTRGQKDILLTVTGGEVFEGRDREAKDSMSIILCDGPGLYIFANISSLSNGEVFNENSLVFNSSGSYVKNCSDETCASCVDLIPDSYEWELFRLYSVGYISQMKGYTQDWEVNNIYGVANYKIKLTLAKDGLSESTEKEFSVIYLNDLYGLECVEPSRSTWRNISTDVIFDSLNDCKKEGFGTCCPTNFECIGGVCVDCLEGLCNVQDDFLCLGYPDEESCEDFNLNVAKQSVKDKREDSKTCSDTLGFIDGCIYSLENCRCEWNESISQCVAKVDVVPSLCNSTPSGGEYSKVGICVYSEDTMGDSCSNDGFLTYSWSANWIWADENPSQEDPLGESLLCVDGSRTIPCPTQISLSFFTLLEFGIAILVIFLIYYLIFLFKNKKNSKKKKSVNRKDKLKKKK